MPPFNLCSEELHIDQTSSEAGRMHELEFGESYADEALMQRMILMEEKDLAEDDNEDEEEEELLTSNYEGDEEETSSLEEEEEEEEEEGSDEGPTSEDEDDGESSPSEIAESHEEGSSSEEDENCEEQPLSEDEESDVEPWIFGRPDALDEVLLCEENEESRAYEEFLFPRLPSYQEAMREDRPPLYEDDIISHLLPFISPPLYEDGTLIVGAPPPYDGRTASVAFPQALLPEGGIFSSNVCAEMIQPYDVENYLCVIRDDSEDEGPVLGNWLFGESSLDSSPEVTVELRSTPLQPRILTYEDLFGTAEHPVDGLSAGSSCTGLVVTEQLQQFEGIEITQGTHSACGFAERRRAFSITKFLRRSTRLIFSCVRGNRES